MSPRPWQTLPSQDSRGTHIFKKYHNCLYSALQGTPAGCSQRRISKRWPSRARVATGCQDGRSTAVTFHKSSFALPVSWGAKHNSPPSLSWLSQIGGDNFSHLIGWCKTSALAQKAVFQQHTKRGAGVGPVHKAAGGCQRRG